MKKFRKLLSSLVIPVAIGVAIGVFGIRSGVIPGDVAEAAGEYGDAPGLPGILLRFAAMLVSLIAGAYINIIIHEAGHLVAGKLSGYKFISFRVGSLVIIREDGRLVRKKYGIAGTGGQCLMSPPDVTDTQYNYPFILYNLGGGLANLLFSVPLLLIGFLASGYIFMAFFIFAGIGILLGLINLIPLKLGGIANDGLNIIACRKRPETRRALWIQLRYAELITQGVPICDIPQEWVVESTGAPTDALTGFLVSFRCYCYLSKGEIEQARDYAKSVIENPGKMLELHINELRCELLFCELIRECRADEINKLYTANLQNHIKALATHLSKQRLIYAYEHLFTKNIVKADKAMAAFEKACLHTPFKGEVPGERGLVELVKRAGKL